MNMVISYRYGVPINHLGFATSALTDWVKCCMQLAEILQVLDEEISRLQQARTILADSAPIVPRLSGTAQPATPDKKLPVRRMVSAEGRARIIAAQKRRWAAVKKL